MPMIIKGGKRYCSSSNLAEDIIYDNENSSLEATNTQEAIDELNSKLDNLAKRINNISFVVDENGDWCFLPDGSSTPIKLTEYREKKKHTATGNYSGDINGTVFNIPITFGCEFASPPIVTVKFTVNEDGKFTLCSAKDVTTTGFTLYMTKEGTTNPRECAVSWTATGYVYI